MLTDIFGRSVTTEMWRTITGIEELNRRGLGSPDDVEFAHRLASEIGISDSEAMQRLAWFEEWMREPVFIANLPEPEAT